MATATFRRDGDASNGAAGIWNYTNINSQATTVVKSSSGILHCLIINTPTATTTVTMYDNTAASGTKIGTLTIASGQPALSLEYDIEFLNGLTIVTGTANSDITVAYA